jgi:hypothetical protein
MSNTIIIGDMIEGQKYFGEAAFLTQQLVAQYKRSNANMQTWKQVTDGVSIFVKMVNGFPQAFIYALAGGYEFFVPSGMLNIETFRTSGTLFFEGVEQLGDPKILFKEESFVNASMPIGVWYSTNNYIASGGMVRYNNVKQVQSDTYKRTFQVNSLPKYYPGGTTGIYQGLSNLRYVTTSAVLGKYIWGVLGGSTDEPCVLHVRDMETQEVVFEAYIEGTWQEDYNDTNVHGQWSINRAGDKACCVTWVTQRNRFEADNSILNFVSGNIPAPQRFQTSYVFELQIVLDSEGNFAGAFKTLEYETPDFCIAADYDWTTEDNELIFASLNCFDYMLADADPPNFIDVDAEIFWGAIRAPYDTTLYFNDFPIGTRFRTLATYIGSDIDRGNSLKRAYMMSELTRYGYIAGDGLPRPPWFTNYRETAMDVWLTIDTQGGQRIGAVELAHNWGIDSPWENWDGDYDDLYVPNSTGQWYQRDGLPTVINNISGLDLRVRGVTGYADTVYLQTQPTAVQATAYGKSWDNGTPLPTSGANPPEGAGNMYVPDLVFQRIKTFLIPQTIAAVPYTVKDPEEIRDLCIYAPYVINEQTGESDPDLAIDFRIDFQNADSKDTAFQDRYHRTIYEKTHDEVPYLNRYFVSGAWAKKKDVK